MGRKKQELKKLFFTPQFSTSLPLQDKFNLQVGSVRPGNKKQISEGLKFMSAESIRNRFQGSKKAFTEKELKYLTELDGWNHYAIGVLENSGARRGVAIIRFVRSSEKAQEAEIAITIIDEYQRCGLGSILLDLMVLAALEREIETLCFTFLPQNEGIQRLVKRIGVPKLVQLSQDSVQLFLPIRDLRTQDIKERLLPDLPLLQSYF